MDIKKLNGEISNAKYNYQKALSDGFTITRSRESLRNVLENSLDEILEALAFAENAEEKTQLLEVELADAERELDEKDDEIKGLKKQLEAKEKPKSGK